MLRYEAKKVGNELLDINVEEAIIERDEADAIAANNEMQEFDSKCGEFLDSLKSKGNGTETPEKK